MTTLAELTLVEAADAVRTGEVRPGDLLDACWDNIAACEPALNATIWLDRAGAEQAAEDAGAALRSGRSPGLLHGVPLAHKDMFAQRGRRCTCGSAIRREFIAADTATVIARLDQAGASAFGGLNMAEFAQNATGHNSAYGDCHNPWNTEHIAGGSSSGSAAAVAARYVYAALGSDSGGSIRIPASACGVTGLKPTYGRVSRAGAMPLSFSHDTIGPLARTARDCARMLRVIAGHDPRDPASSSLPVPDYESALDGDLRGLRIGVAVTHFHDDADAMILAAVAQAVAVLRARGAATCEIGLPLMDAINAYARVVSRVEAAAVHAQWMRERPGDYARHVSAPLYATYAIPASYYAEALARRGSILAAFVSEVFSAVDVLITPTLRIPVPTLAETDLDRNTPGADHVVAALTANTRPFNYLGLPAISVPCGFDGNALPIGMQLTGRPFAEARLLKVAEAYQRDTAWHHCVPMDTRCV